MTWEILYFIVTLFCIRHAYVFYKTKDGNFRKAWMYFFLALAFNFIMRVIGETFKFQDSLVGFISITPILFTMVYLYYVIETYGNRKQ